MSDARKRPTVDERSYELAEYFLQGDLTATTDDDKWSLAAAIQQAVEDWFEARP